MQDEALELASEAGIEILIDGQTQLGSTRILGTTLWTDYAATGLPLRVAMRHAAKWMNDYRRIRRPSSTRTNRKIRPEDILHMHRVSAAWLASCLSVPFDGTTVVVTHHAPPPEIDARSLRRL